MNIEEQRTNLEQSNQTKSENIVENKQADLMKKLNLDQPSDIGGEGVSIDALKENDKSFKSMPNLQTIDQKDLPSKQSESQPTEIPEKNESPAGIFSKVGNAISSAIDKAKEIIFPDLGVGEEEAPKEKETEKSEEKQDVPTQEEKKDKNWVAGEEKLLEQQTEKTEEKPYEMPSQQQPTDLKEKPISREQDVDKTRQPAYIVGQGEDKIVYYYSSDKILESSDLLQPVTESESGGMRQPLLPEKGKEIEQPMHGSVRHQKEEDRTQPEYDVEKVRNKIEGLNLNEDKPHKESEKIQTPEKEEPIYNPNFYQDISKALQFGGKLPEQTESVSQKDQASVQQKIL